MFPRIPLRPAENWREILKKAWSIRLLFIAAILSAIEAAIPFLTFVPAPQGFFAIMSALATGAAFVARLLAQKNMKDDE
jgi:hypothetical protein